MGGAPTEWLRVAVEFTGDCFGHMVLHVAHDVARDLVSAFMGLMPDEEVAEELLADAIGEFGNMVCGAWLTDAATRLNFALKPPQVTREGAGFNPIEALSADDGEGTAYGMALNERPALLRVRLEALL
jgi:CheY-specific phosphatase CheX